MAEVKWIKIKTDIFDDEKILLIESMPDPYAIITVWFKLLCLAGKQNNSGVFMLGKIAYTDKMLATIFRMNEATVTMSLNVFEQFEMIEIIDGVITIPNWGKHQNLDQLESKKAYMKNYMQDYREKQKALADGGKTNCKTNSKTNCKTNSKTNVSQADKEEDKDIEKDKNNICASQDDGTPTKTKRFTPPTIEEVTAYCKERGNKVDPQRFIDFYASKGWMVGSTKMRDFKAAIRNWERNDYSSPQRQTHSNIMERSYAEQDMMSKIPDPTLEFML